MSGPLDDLVASLRERAEVAREEGNATARVDARHFDESAEAITALRAENERLREAVKRDAVRRLRSLVGWLEESPDNATLLLASLSQAEINRARAILGDPA